VRIDNRHAGRVRLGDPLLDRYLEFVEGRARPNTVIATASDLRFFAVVRKPVLEVTSGDVLAFITAQRRPAGDGRVVRLMDGEAGLSVRTIKRRLSSVSGLFGYLVMCDIVPRNPVPHGLATRRRGNRPVALIRSPRLLPNILNPAEVDALFGALRRWRDRAMVEAMVLGALRRCEVVGLRFDDLRPGDRRGRPCPFHRGLGPGCVSNRRSQQARTVWSRRCPDSDGWTCNRLDHRPARVPRTC
jgi:site-specific recombinase XerD